MSKGAIRKNWTLYAARIVSVGLNFLSMLILALLMSPSEFGGFVWIWALANVLSSVTALGGPAFLLREGSARQADASRGVTFGQAVRVAVLWPVGLLCLIGAVALGNPFGILANIGVPELSARLVILTGLSALVLNLVSHLAIPFRLAGHEVFSMLLRDAAPQSILLISGLVLSLFGPVLQVGLLTSFFALGLLLCGGAVLVAHRGSVVGVPLWRSDGASGRMTGLRSFWASSVLGTISSQLDILLGGFVLSDVALGHYQILKRLANLVGLPQIVANWSVAVEIGRAHADGRPADIQSACSRGLRLSLLPGLVLSLAAAVSLPVFVWIYGLDGDLEMWLAFLFLLGGVIVNLASGTNFMLAAQCRLEALAMLARILAVAVTGLLILSLGDWLSAVALAAIAFVASFISNTFLCIALWRRLGVDASILSMTRKAHEQ